ncbi:hypothetical protein RHGRI_011666 [Rhododendron griersonianum]|uniref:non-specific serine/threonine protein kinase n=1 Tax=Rhododendron griersonianum TaxID=479676 RepID=A0AAV6KNM6_9ERIC|nr:hypothetical protein RHGRI_011666 [Rhododendron griersonianum]
MFLTPLFALSPLLLLVLALLPSTPAQDHLSFTFNNFKASPNLTLDGIAEFKPSGLLALTNGTRQQKGHAFFPTPFLFKPSPNATASSFSTSFIFSIIPEIPTHSGHGIVFVVAPAPGLPGAHPSKWLGLFNETNHGNFDNHVVAVELDTIYSIEFDDINDNHVGIDINGLDSVASKAAGYYSSNGRFQNLTLISGIVYYVRRKRKFAEVLEDWELDYGPHRFKYKDLYIATEGFREKQLLGSGGFGKVYRGILPTSGTEIAVKRVSHESRQGMREFVAEIVSVGRMRHRNLVQLLGEILQTVDPKLGSQYVAEEVELVLKLGLWCSHSEPVARPSMRQVVQYLEGDIHLPELKLIGNSATGLMFAHREGFDDFALSYLHSSSVAESLLFGGR